MFLFHEMPYTGKGIITPGMNPWINLVVRLHIGPTSFHNGLLRCNQIHIMKTLMYLNLDLKNSVFNLQSGYPKT